MKCSQFFVCRNAACWISGSGFNFFCDASGSGSVFMHVYLLYNVWIYIKIKCESQQKKKHIFILKTQSRIYRSARCTDNHRMKTWYSQPIWHGTNKSKEDHVFLLPLDWLPPPPHLCGIYKFCYLSHLRGRGGDWKFQRLFKQIQMTMLLSSSPKHLLQNMISGIFSRSTHRVYRLEIANFLPTFIHVGITIFDLAARWPLLSLSLWFNTTPPPFPVWINTNTYGGWDIGCVGDLDR
jgi:hypothetical protein